MIADIIVEAENILRDRIVKLEGDTMDNGEISVTKGLIDEKQEEL